MRNLVTFQLTGKNGIGNWRLEAVEKDEFSDLNVEKFFNIIVPLI